MPRNKTGGKKTKKGKNDVVRKFITISKEDKECQRYAVVERALGNNRFELKFLNGDTILGIKRKAIKRYIYHFIFLNFSYRRSVS